MQPLPPSSYSVYDAYEFAKSHGAPFVQLRSGKIVRLADWPTFRDCPCWRDSLNPACILGVGI